MAGGVGKVIAARRRGRQVRVLAEGEAQGDGWRSSPPCSRAALGSIPQQDVFQRVTSAKDEKTAVRGTLLGGSIYFCFAFVPIFLAYCALLIDPKMVEPLLKGESSEIQRILPNLILEPHAAVRAGDVLRRAALGDPVDRLRRAARADARCSPRT